MAEAESLVLAHPLGSPFATNAALGLAETGCRIDVATCFSYNIKGALARMLSSLPHSLGSPLARELERRAWIPTGMNARHVATHHEILRMALEQSGLRRLLGIRSGRLTDLMYVAFDRAVANSLPRDTTAVYAYEDGACETFRRAHKDGVLCIYDLPIMYHRKSAHIFAEERERYPEFCAALPLEPEWKVNRKDEEARIADHIVVASTITKSSLVEHGIPAEKISVIPYGVHMPDAPMSAPDRFSALFVGRIGPRKGVHYLLDAWRSMGGSRNDLLLVGVNEFPDKWLASHLGLARYQPSLPRSELTKVYRSSSVLVLPSLVEGFGMVILEAMSCGIPVITTSNTAGPEIIEPNVDGFVVPIRNTEALRETLAWCADHPKELREMGHRAQEKAALFSWARYRQSLGNTVTTLFHR